MKARVLIVLAVVALCCALPAEVIAQGCSMCKAVAESGQGNANAFGGAQPVGEGLNKGIILLMIVPYVLLFLFFRKRIASFWKEFAGAQG